MLRSTMIKANFDVTDVIFYNVKLLTKENSVISDKSNRFLVCI